MDFRQLENFVEVCERMSFTKAASNLYISQQGVSKSIKALEEELGVKLFFRTNSSLALTNYGTILLQHARGLVKDYTAILAEINAEKNRDKDSIMVGITNGGSNFLPVSLLEDYLQAHPNIRLSIREYNDTKVDEALLSGEIDIGFCVGPVDGKTLKIHHTHNMNLYFLLGENHPLANESAIDLRQLKNGCFIAMGDGEKGEASFLERCRKAGFVPNIGIRVSDVELMMSLCRKNLGVGVYAGDSPAELPGLRVIPDKLHVWEHSVHICTALEHGVSAQEEEFISCFRAW